MNALQERRYIVDLSKLHITREAVKMRRANMSEKEKREAESVAKAGRRYTPREPLMPYKRYAARRLAAMIVDAVENPNGANTE